MEKLKKQQNSMFINKYIENIVQYTKDGKEESVVYHGKPDYIISKTNSSMYFPNFENIFKH